MGRRSAPSEGGRQAGMEGGGISYIATCATSPWCKVIVSSGKQVCKAVFWGQYVQRGTAPPQRALPCKAPPLVIFQAERHWEQRLWRSVAGLHGITYSLCSWNSSRLPVSASSVQIHQVSTRLTIPRGKRRQREGDSYCKSRCLRRTCGALKDRTAIVPSSASLTFNQGN